MNSSTSETENRTKPQQQQKRTLSHKNESISDHLSIDTIIEYLSRTIFRPGGAILASLANLAIYSHSDWRFFVSLIWAALLTFISLWNHVDRLYANQSRWFLNPPKLNWEEQIVLITGGGSGIGALLAKTLTERNAKVVILTKDPPQSESSNSEIKSYICDVSHCKEVDAVAAKVRKEVGHPTIIINNAGVVKGKLLLDLTEEDINDTFGANTLAHFWVLKAFLPAMIKEGKGHVVTVSSLLGLIGTAQMTDYCASKAAVVSLNQTLRFELDNRYKTPSIRTTLVLPSFIQTKLFDKVQLPPSRIWNFFCPPLRPETVVRAIISAMEEQESRIIRLPWYTNGARFMGDGTGLIPAWLRDALQWVAGADFAMREYGPRPDAAERLAAEKEQERGIDLDSKKNR
ncbi:hypothetical protein CI109_101211 [Kwoniella shandongensis]|uniref:Short-chain dehydrogenase/reductase 3 n=1 Tax=Kwoniella shandongensis TaxID=1734106 RepID=A0A5M6BTZ2_9TREE|nr:uncharacterized protein CI109_005471 [Kwoniella shandongensis]KAA5526193.1 hypothetical protein CI109_005471 [Kwoniella shandongensis]